MAQNRRATVARELDMLGYSDHRCGDIEEYRFMAGGRAVYARSGVEQIGRDVRITMAIR